MYYFLFTFTDGIQTLYIFVSTPHNPSARKMAFLAVESKLGIANQQGLQLIKELKDPSELITLLNNNDHYNLNFREINNLLKNNEPGASCGEWVKD
jgi:hypothetical protein